mmetsp:Transcript_10761/g.16051  ORF Transcript_10761/g.16051 Transcript_10761/m.16051 type:complete len:226 (+) Transcript_10761:492-1169(+)
MLPQHRINMRIQFQIVLVNVIEQLLGTQNSGYLHQLIIIVMPMKKRLFTENHSSKHASQTPHIQRVIVLLQVNQQLRPLEVARSHPDIVLPSGVIELSQPPIDQPQHFLGMIDHHIVRLNISVHDAVAVTVVQRFQQLKHIKSNVEISQSRIQNLEVGVVDVFENQTWGFALGVSHNVQELNDVHPAAQVLENFYFPLYFLFLDRFENFDNTFCIVDHVHSLKNF